MAKTIGFYQNFNLDLQRLSNALRCVQSDPEMGHSALAHCMSVNAPVAEGFSSWLRHAGLTITVTHTEPQKTATHKLSPFGELVYRHDPTLMDRGTQWILHYYLSTKRVESSDAWYVLINRYLPICLNFTSDQFQSYFTSTIGDSATNQLALSKDPLAALSTYTRSDALAQLHILEKQNKKYIVRQPYLPPTLVVGYMLLDWWQYHYNETNTLRFSQLCHEEESIGRLCLIEASQVRQYIIALTGLGYLSFSETQHEPVHRLYQDQPILLLERYYIQR